MSISDNARKIPGVVAAEGALTGALATEDDLPIAGYDERTAGGDRVAPERLHPAPTAHDRCLRAQARQPRDDHRPRRKAARRAAVGRL